MRTLTSRAARTAAAVALCSGTLVGVNVIVSAGSAQALSCGPTQYGGWRDSGAGFDQQVTVDYCTGGIVRVGVRVFPRTGYTGSHVKGCSAHLVLTNYTVGAGTRSDRPQGCSAAAQTWQPGNVYTVGPSQWRNQDSTDHFFAEAYVNIETGVRYYDTYQQRSYKDLPTGLPRPV